MKFGPFSKSRPLGPDRTGLVIGCVIALLLLLVVDVVWNVTHPQVIPPPPPDPGVEAAKEKARETYPVFLAAFNDPQTHQLDFRIRVPVVWEEETHAVWLVEPVLTATSVVGRAESFVPGEVMNVETTPDRIIDWLIYNSDGTFDGGYQLRLEHSRLQGAEREQFEKDAGLNFPEPPASGDAP